MTLSGGSFDSWLYGKGKCQRDLKTPDREESTMKIQKDRYNQIKKKGEFKWQYHFAVSSIFYAIFHKVLWEREGLRCGCLLLSWVTAWFNLGEVGYTDGRCLTLPQHRHSESPGQKGWGRARTAVWFYFYRLVGFDVNECVPRMYRSGLRGGKDGALRGNKKIRRGGGSKVLQLVLVQWCHLLGWVGVIAGLFSSCEAGCTSHSALCQAGSWRCSEGRTT